MQISKKRLIAMFAMMSVFTLAFASVAFASSNGGDSGSSVKTVYDAFNNFLGSLVYLGGPAVRLVGLLFIAFSIRSGYKKYTDDQGERTPWWRIIVGIAIGGALLFGGVPLIIAIAKTVSGIFQNKEKLGVDQIPGANN
jgi:trbC/VIRB2 family